MLLTSMCGHVRIEQLVLSLCTVSRPEIEKGILHKCGTLSLLSGCALTNATEWRLKRL